MSIQILGMAVSEAGIAAVLVAFIGGMCVPFRYGIERLRGFGRAVVSRLPYKPPADPGGSTPEGAAADGDAVVVQRDESGQFAGTSNGGNGGDSG
ncbi:hypothetical protein [Halobaculum sp. EA56]|uniref:hypothetical protein n=1 Tax=Halobaculum sp. EA56 TaxID=3421648 RepID=UPI003EBAE60D